MILELTFFRLIFSLGGARSVSLWWRREMDAII
jgi:hypothetical protein